MLTIGQKELVMTWDVSHSNVDIKLPFQGLLLHK
jgi:hypothetical protein